MSDLAALGNKTPGAIRAMHNAVAEDYATVCAS